MLNREQLLAVNGDKIELVKDVPHWGDVYIKTFSAGKRDEIEGAHQSNPFVNFRARFVAASVCDEHGKLVFTDKDVPAISALAASIVDPVFTAVAKLNKILPEDIDELEKNSEGVHLDN